MNTVIVARFPMISSAIWHNVTRANFTNMDLICNRYEKNNYLHYEVMARNYWINNKKQFHPTLCWARDYIYMFLFVLIHVG